MAKIKISRKKSIFFFVEGECEVSFIKFLKEISNNNIAPITKDLNGSTNKAMLENALSIRKRLNISHGNNKISYFICDGDKLGVEGNFTEAELISECNKNKFQLILLRPNYEGLLLKLFKKYRNKDVTKYDKAERELKTVWNDYKKPENALKLQRKFNKNDLINASQSCPEISILLDIFEIK